MGFWDVITGRTRPKQANLDSLFLVPSAAITLETTLGLRPTGEGSVCFRAAAGAAFQQTQDDVVELLNADPDAPDVEVSRDEFGFTWLVGPPRPRRHRGPLHRPARRQHLAGGRRASARACSAPWSRSPTRAGAGSASSTSTSRASSTLRAERSAAARQPAGDPDPRHACRRAADGAGPQPLARGLGSTGSRGRLRLNGWGVSPCGSCRGGRASARGRPGPTSRSRGRPRSG